MKRPKGKLLAMLVLLGAIGVAAATGAFTVVQAERTADVDVAGDSSALLGFDTNSPYANMNAGAQGDQLQISFAGYNDASGVNQNAITQIDGIFNITNNGQQSTAVWIETIGDNDTVGDNVVFFVHIDDVEETTADSGSYTTLAEADVNVAGVAEGRKDEYVIITDAANATDPNSVELPAGRTVTVNMYIDFMNVNDTNDAQLESITIVADSNTDGDVTDSTS